MNIFDMGFSGFRGIFERRRGSGTNSGLAVPGLAIKVDLSPALTIERTYKTDWRGFQRLGKVVLALDSQGTRHAPAPSRCKKQSGVPPIGPTRGLGATATSQPVGLNRLIDTSAVSHGPSVPG